MFNFRVGILALFLTLTTFNHASPLTDSNQRRTLPINCPTGSGGAYCTYGQFFPFICLGGFYLTGTPAKQGAKCLPCGTNTWSIQGYYSPGPNSQLVIPTCTNCLIGTTCSTTGVVLSCLNGYGFSTDSITGLNTCTGCSTNMYAAAGKNLCTSCLISTVGVSSCSSVNGFISTCQPSYGYAYNPNNDLYSIPRCLPCNPTQNTFATGGQNACNSCTVLLGVNTCSTAGSIISCIPGYGYSVIAGKSTCTNCALTNSWSNGLKACTLCANNGIKTCVPSTGFASTCFSPYFISGTSCMKCRGGACG